MMKKSKNRDLSKTKQLPILSFDGMVIDNQGSLERAKAYTGSLIEEMETI
ncbi:hypothetical protein [Streptococcus catagoni]|nr:hypothetical protein [Streptococcus catagoni]